MPRSTNWTSFIEMSERPIYWSLRIWILDLNTLRLSLEAKDKDFIDGEASEAKMLVDRIRKGGFFRGVGDRIPGIHSLTLRVVVCILVVVGLLHPGRTTANIRSRGI